MFCNLGTNDIQGKIIPCCGATHACRMFSNFAGLYYPIPAASPTPVTTIKNVSRYFQISFSPAENYWVKNMILSRPVIPTFSAPGTIFMEDNFSMDWGRGRGGNGSGGNENDGQ